MSRPLRTTSGSLGVPLLKQPYSTSLKLVGGLTEK